MEITVLFLGVYLVLGLVSLVIPKTPPPDYTHAFDNNKYVFPKLETIFEEGTETDYFVRYQAVPDSEGINTKNALLYTDQNKKIIYLVSLHSGRKFKLPKVPPYPYNAALYTNSERFYDAESNSYWYRMLFYDGYQYFLVLDEKIEERK